MGCKRLDTDFFSFLEVVTSEKSDRGEKKRVNYYPFGLQHKGYNDVITSNSNSVGENFTYLSQEEQNDLGLNWISYKWRNADSALGRFFGVDPIAEDYPNQTVYQFASNNPIWKIEIEGLEGYETEGTDLINGLGFSGHTMLPVEDQGFIGGGESDVVMMQLEGVAPASTDIRSGMFNDSEFSGALYPASDQQYDEYPVAAFLQDVTYVGLSVIGVDNIDNSISTISNPNVSTSEKVKAGVGVILTPKGGGKKGSVQVSRTGRPLPKAQTNGGRALDPKTKQPIGGSGKARPVTVKHATRKRAKDAARNAGKGTPVKHTQDRKGGNHYHRGDGKTGKGKGTKGYGSNAGKVSDNVHHEYPTGG